MLHLTLEGAQTHFNKLSLKEVEIYKKDFFYSMLISAIIIVIELLFFIIINQQ